MQRVADGALHAKPVEYVVPDRIKVGGWGSRPHPPVRASRQRGTRWIARQREGQPVNVAVGKLIGPELVEIGQQRWHIRHGGVQVTVDGTVERHFHGCDPSSDTGYYSICRSIGRQALKWRSIRTSAALITSTSAVATTMPVNTPVVSKFWREYS